MYYGYAAGNLQQQSYKPKKAPWEEREETAGSISNPAQTKQKTTSPPKEQKPKKEEEDPFLAGFNKYDNEEKERLEKFARIRANADKRTWVNDKVVEDTQKQNDPFLSGFNQTKDEELAEIREKERIFNPKTRDTAFEIGKDGKLVSPLSLNPINYSTASSEKEEKKPDEKSKWQKGLDYVSAGLTAASFIPGLDTFTNIAQIPVDLLRGDFVGAGLDLVGVLPLVGEVADIAKTGRTVDRIVDGAKAADKALDTAKALDKASDTVKVADDVADTAKAVDNAGATVNTAGNVGELAKTVDEASGTVNTVDTIKHIFNSADDPIFELTKRADSIAVSSPIEIPKMATMQPQVKKNGYYQLKYTWVTDDGIEYTSRWHTPRPNAPIEKYDTWVIERKLPDITYNGSRKVSSKQILVGKNKWVSKTDWDAARRARGKGTLTMEQEEMLRNGHWKAQKQQ